MRVSRSRTVSLAVVLGGLLFAAIDAGMGRAEGENPADAVNATGSAGPPDPANPVKPGDAKPGDAKPRIASSGEGDEEGMLVAQMPATVAGSADDLAAEMMAADPRRTSREPLSAFPGIGRDLYLEVLINEVSTETIVNFKQLPDGGMIASIQDLAQIGLKPTPSAQVADGFIRIDQLPGVTFRLDEPTQRLRVTAIDDARIPRTIDLNGRRRDIDNLIPESSIGLVANYSLYASSRSLFTKYGGNLLSGVSAAFDTRLFSPYGTLGNSFSLTHTAERGSEFRRLSSNWSYSDPDNLVTYVAGDLVSGGLSWTRPVYLGGIQGKRNFSLRSDLVTIPMPSFSGTAAVPSTLEVYSQNMRVYSADIAPGPFTIPRLPVLTGSGEARVVLRDSLGRETTTTLPFYTSNMLLREGLLDFSLDLGYPRLSYGLRSDTYDKDVAGVMTGRYGVTDWLTVSGHMEGTRSLINGGGDFVLPLSSYGSGSLALAGSSHEGKKGALTSASAELREGAWSIFSRIQKSFGMYEDVASVSARSAVTSRWGLIFSTQVPKESRQVVLSMPIPFDGSNISFAYTDIVYNQNKRSTLGSVSYGRQIYKSNSFYVSAFKDFREKNSLGFYAGVSLTLDDRISGSLGVNNTHNDTTFTAGINRSGNQEEGSASWYARASRGSKYSTQSVGLSYPTPVARLQTDIYKYGNDVQATVSADGAVTVAGGDIFATNQIYDAFAVVDVGVPGVEVRHRNVVAGTSNGWGHVLIPNLNSYEPNTIEIDPKNLPIDAEIPSTKQTVMPADRSGVVVDFGINPKPSVALVSFVDSRGEPMPAGAQGHLIDNNEPFVIGYDGEAYIRQLQPNNTVEIERVDGATCRAEFLFEAEQGSQVAIKNVMCQ